MAQKRPPLTLAEHEQLGELLHQAGEALYQAYQLARKSYTMAELQPLERLWRTNGALGKVRSWFDNQLYLESPQRDDPPGTNLGRVYYGVYERLEQRKDT